MKFILLLFLILSSSCSWKKSNSSNQDGASSNVLVMDSPDDIDGDLLSSSEELFLGTNSEIANIPEFKIFHVPSVLFSIRIQKGDEIKNLKIESVFNENDVNKEKLLNSKRDRISSRISKLHLRELQDDVLNKSDMLEPFEDNISIIPIKNRAYFEWMDYKNEGWSIKDGFIYLNFQLEISDLKGVTKIDKISYSLGTITDESKFDQLYFFPELFNLNTTPAIFENFGDINNFKDSRIFKTSLNGLNGSKIDDILSRRSSLAMSFNDFTIKRFNKNYSYKALKDSISAKNAYVIIKINDSYERIITPYKQSLESILKSRYEDVRSDSSGNILSINDYSSTMIFPINTDILSTQSIDNGNWRIIAPEKTIKAVPLPKIVTIISYSSVSEFLTNLKKDNKDNPIINKDVGYVSLIGFSPNDLVSVELEDRKRLPVSRVTSKNWQYDIEHCEPSPFIDEDVFWRGGVDGPKKGPPTCSTYQKGCTYQTRYIDFENISTGSIVNLDEVVVSINRSSVPINKFLEDESDIYVDRSNKIHFFLKIEPKILHEEKLEIFYSKPDTWTSNPVGYIGGCNGKFHPDDHAGTSNTLTDSHLNIKIQKIKSNYREN